MRARGILKDRTDRSVAETNAENNTEEIINDHARASASERDERNTIKRSLRETRVATRNFRAIYGRQPALLAKRNMYLHIAKSPYFHVHYRPIWMELQRDSREKARKISRNAGSLDALE